jgi:uncharacterized phage protein gp47/JayE
MDQLTATGLEIDDYATRVATVIAGLRASISPVLDVSTDQPTGQFIKIQTEQIQAIAELLQELHSAIDPDQATNRSLDAVSSITGTYRRAATHGSVTLTLTLGAAITVPAGSIASVSGDPDNQWILDEDVTSVAAGDYTGTATAATAGALQALAGTITIITTPVAGWTAVTNAADAVEGSEEETDTELRLRREIEVTTGGSTSVDSIAAAVSQVTGIIEVYCYENATNRVVAPMPPHSIEIVYWDGGAAAADTDEITSAIFEEKTAGIQAYGTSSTIVEDSQGNEHTIGYTLADEQRILVEVDVNSDGTVADTALETAIETLVGAFGPPGIGDEVYRSKISAEVSDLDGVLNVVAVRLSIHPAAVAAADIIIGPREIATISSGDVTAAVV